MNIEQILKAQRKFFAQHKTKEVEFRISRLKKLKEVIRNNEERILDALWKDLRKSKEEAYLTEILLVIQEIDLHIKKLKKWSNPKKVPTPLHLLPSRSRIYYEPLGVALIIAPWNYLFN